MKISDMLKRLILGIPISTALVILPVLGNVDILHAPHLWILIIIGVLASVFQPSYNPITIASSAGDRATGAQIIWSVYATQLAAILEAAYLRYPHSVQWDAAAVTGLVGAAFGLSLRSWAVLALGNLFTMHISVQKGHKIIRTGPYAIIRHPSYLGAFVLYLSTAIFLHAWFSFIAAAIILPFAFLRRIDSEESVLKKVFGSDYKSYCKEVKMILPWIW